MEIMLVIPSFWINKYVYIHQIQHSSGSAGMSLMSAGYRDPGISHVTLIYCITLQFIYENNMVNCCLRL